MNKQALLVISVIVIVSLAGWMVWKNRQDEAASPVSTLSDQYSTQATPAAAGTEPTGSAATRTARIRVPKPATPSARYQAAFTKYGDAGNGHLIQLDETCHGVPGTLLIKKGLDFMIDNRSEVEVSVRYEDQAFNIPAWDFRIVTAQTAGKHFITCEGGGAAEVTVAP